MAFAKNALTTTWAAISAEGGSGVCWILNSRSNSKTGDVLVHRCATADAPSGTEDIDNCFKLFRDGINRQDNSIIFTLAAKAGETWYGRAETGTQDLIVSEA